MKVFRINTVTKPPKGRFPNYAGLGYAKEADRKLIKLDDFLGTPFSRVWKPIKLFIEEPRYPKPDIYSWLTGNFVCNEKDYDILGTTLEMCGELLPVSVEGESGEFFAFNATRCLNVLDYQNTVWRWLGKKEIKQLDKPAFHPDRFGEAGLFKIPEDGGVDIYCLERTGEPEDGEFKALVEHAKLTGVEFELVWTDETTPEKKDLVQVSTADKRSPQKEYVPPPQDPSIRIDSHQHFWRYDGHQYPWIPEGSPLHRDWLPGKFGGILNRFGFGGSIAVQARQAVAESDWLLGLADANHLVKGVVGWVDLRSERVAEDLARLARHPKFVGVRHVVQDEPDEQFLIRPEFVRGIAELRQFSLTYDLLIFPKQLPAAIELVKRFPEQPFVLDHIAKPAIKDGVLEPWSRQIRELAALPNCWCKVSGMVTEADHARWKPEDFRPYLDVVFGAFGEDRLMFGSDWPVCLLAASYERTYRLAADYVGGFSAEAQAKFFGGNCAEFYGVT